ncbi:hypothetical protein Pyn_33736 [Prunus yedoensis var. nudiflora]|uniref:O-methyltransferase dimerisation domain-containing protein n=1 Tax=Prunus yedoensis var. nudiflora TaxID=2094558 RepID=A0A314XMP8_PRUYE|nr:hypothetical protein Pyn_33736 [Prunus yedoensis var. nudiflora]
MGSEVRASHELLQAQAHIWNHIFSFINSMSLKCAVQLGIPDVIQKHGQPMTLSELVSALPISPSKADFIPRLMRILVHSGFFAQESLSGGEQGYVLTDASGLRAPAERQSHERKALLTCHAQSHLNRSMAVFDHLVPK